MLGNAVCYETNNDNYVNRCVDQIVFEVDVELVKDDIYKQHEDYHELSNKQGEWKDRNFIEFALCVEPKEYVFLVFDD